MNINKNYLILLAMPIKNIINQNPSKHMDGKGAEHLNENERIKEESINDTHMQNKPRITPQSDVSISSPGATTPDKPSHAPYIVIIPESSSKSQRQAISSRKI